MKKILLFSLLILISTISVYAYETIIIKYPEKEHWVKAYYKKIGNESIAQYVPYGETRETWKRAIFIHAYKDSNYPISFFINTNLQRMEKANKTSRYTIVRQTDNDAIAARCTEKYNNIDAQCEIFRVTKAHEGTISIHYVNKNKTDFTKNYNEWYKIIKNAKAYNSYYRDERTLDKSEYCEFY